MDYEGSENFTIFSGGGVFIGEFRVICVEICNIFRGIFVKSGVIFRKGVVFCNKSGIKFVFLNRKRMTLCGVFNVNSAINSGLNTYARQRVLMRRSRP